MRVAVLGQGSIGRRHAVILSELGHQVCAYDPYVRAPALEGVTLMSSEVAALDGAHAAIVATPPSEHLRQVRSALQAGVHTLVEKPFAPSASGIAELRALAQERTLTLGVAMNMRFHPGVATVRRLVADGAIGQVLRASIWFGSWLPGWRPGVDYRDTYSAQARLGGGVLLDSIHELDYALWMLGPVRRVQGLLKRSGVLDADVEAVVALVLEHADGAITDLTLDYLDRSYNRGCRVVGELGTVDWCWGRESVVLHSARGETLQLATPSDVQPTYRTQLERFLGATVDGSAPAADATDAIAALELADAARLADAGSAAVEVVQRSRAAIAKPSLFVSNNPS